MLQGHSLIRNIQDFRITVSKPSRRCGGRCAQNYFKSIAVGQINGLVEQFELKVTFLRLKDRPGEFSHPDNGESGFNHPPVIAGPHFLGPLFGVVTYAKLKLFICDVVSHHNLQRIGRTSIEVSPGMGPLSGGVLSGKNGHIRRCRLTDIIKNMLYSDDISIVLSSEMNNI
ncbi:hypothetical protein D3C73_1003630 [compost metagenome]